MPSLVFDAQQGVYSPPVRCGWGAVLIWRPGWLRQVAIVAVFGFAAGWADHAGVAALPARSIACRFRVREPIWFTLSGPTWRSPLDAPLQAG